MMCRPTFGKTAYMPPSRIVQFKSSKEIPNAFKTASKMIKGYQQNFFIKKGSRSMKTTNVEPEQQGIW